jgi:hypothetical protein
MVQTLVSAAIPAKVFAKLCGENNMLQNIKINYICRTVRDKKWGKDTYH